MQKVLVRMLNFATNFCSMSLASDRIGVLIQPHGSAIHTSTGYFFLAESVGNAKAQLGSQNR